MKPAPFLLACLFLLQPSLRAAEEDGWVSLFNGRDLSNWVNVNCAPETWKAEDGVIKCTGTPTGALRLARQYENFIFELDWRHLKSGGNAGIFVWSSPVAAPGVPFLRAIEVQVLDNGYNPEGKNKFYTTHGDVFPIHGSSMQPIYKGNGQRCFPIEERSKSAPEWNHYRIEANQGKLRLSVNGKEVSGGDNCLWKKGFLGLESEGSPTEWKNLRLKELPPSGATEADSAPEDLGWKSLYNGLDLRGFTASLEGKTQWKASDWTLAAPTDPNPEDKLTLPLAHESFELTLDWNAGNGIGEKTPPTLTLQDANGQTVEIDLLKTLPDPTKRDGWHRLSLTRKNGSGKIWLGTNPQTEISGKDLATVRVWSLILSGPSAPRQLANFYVRELK